MRLVERHIIKRADHRFTIIDRAAFASKNLYNKALYATRQAFFQNGSLPNYPTLYHQMKGEPEYAVLPRKVAQWVIKQVCAAWDSYQEALAAYAINPPAFVGRPRLPATSTSSRAGTCWSTPRKPSASRRSATT